MMKAWILGGALMLAATCANAGSFDACYNAADLTQTGRAVGITAQVYPANTIPPGFDPVDCTLITAMPIGTLFVNGTVVRGLPYTDPADFIAGTLNFRLYGGTKLGLSGTMKSGADRSYDLLVNGAFGLTPAAGVATLTNLDPTGSAFEVNY